MYLFKVQEKVKGGYRCMVIKDIGKSASPFIHLKNSEISDYPSRVLSKTFNTITS